MGTDNFERLHKWILWLRLAVRSVILPSLGNLEASFKGSSGWFFWSQFQSGCIFSVGSSSHSLEPMPQFQDHSSILCFPLHLQIFQGWPPSEVLQEEGGLWTSVPASLCGMLLQEHQGRELIRYWSMQLQTVTSSFPWTFREINQKGRCAVDQPSKMHFISGNFGKSCSLPNSL